MKKTYKYMILLSFLVFGCSSKTPQPSEQAESVAKPQETSKVEQVQDAPKAEADVPQEGQVEKPQKDEDEHDNSVKDEAPDEAFRPFRFTVDLDQYYQQRFCNEDSGQCKSFQELNREPEITIHLVEIPDVAVKYDVDCDGDGNYELTGLTQSTACKYETKTGKFQISIRGELPGLILCGDDEDDPMFDFSNSKAVLSVDQWGDIRWKSMHAFAANCLNIKLPEKEAPILKDVTDMSNVFQGAVNFNQSIEHWDISHVTNLSHAFIAAFSFNKPLNRWNTSNVTDMSYTFMLCRAFNQPLDKWDVSKVKDMSGLFTEANAFNQPIASWDVSNVTKMDGMFRGASSFNQPIGSWNVSHVIDMQGMFNRATSFNQPLDKWDVAGVRTMNAMFWGATAFKQNIDAWNVSRSRDTHAMFQDSGRNDLPRWYRE